MPVVFREGGLRYFYYAHEGDPLEPVHIHVTNGPDTAKFWLKPVVTLAKSQGFPPKELRKIRTTIIRHVDMIEEHWNEFFREAGRL